MEVDFRARYYSLNPQAMPFKCNQPDRMHKCNQLDKSCKINKEENVTSTASE